MFERFFGEAKGIFNIITIVESIISILFIIIGLIFFTNPQVGNIVVSIIIGLLLISFGASSIFSYIKRNSIVLFNNNLIYGIILIIIGIVSMYGGKVLSIIVAIYLIICGIQKANYGFYLKKYNESSWLITLAVGILFAIIGIISFFTNGESVVEVVGICILGFGLINLTSVVLLRRRSKYFIV